MCLLQALRCLALIRLGRQDETTSTLQEVHLLHPNDEHTLQAMAMCYRDVNRRMDCLHWLKLKFSLAFNLTACVFCGRNLDGKGGSYCHLK